MTKLSFSNVLLLNQLAIVCLIGAGAMWSASHVLGQVGADQATEHVRLLTIDARLSVEEASDELRNAARLLSQRPTLHGYAREGNWSEAREFLGQYRLTGRIDVIQVENEGDVLLRVGESPFIGGLGLMMDTDTRHLWAIRSARMSDEPHYLVRVMRRVDTLMKLPPTDTASMHLLPLDQASLDTEWSASPTQGAFQLSGGRGFAAREVLLDRDGQPLAVIQGKMSYHSAIEPVRQAKLRLLGSLIIILAVAALLALLTGRRLSQPVNSLTDAAFRIGSGDLATPVNTRVGASRELGVLASTMELSRERLQRAEAARASQQSELQAIVAGVHDGIIAVDMSRRITLANTAAAQILGVSIADLEGRFCGDVLQPLGENGERPCEHDCPLLKARSTGLTSAIERCRGQFGGIRNLLLHSSPPQMDRQVLIFREQTPREAARHLRDAILANLSHEFQTPLAAQIASIELLKDHLDERDDSVGTRLLMAQHRGALRLSQLVDNMLESVRFESDAVHLKRTRFELDELVNEAVELLAPLFDQRGQRVVMDCKLPVPSLRADRNRLLQVCTNILGNANKFAPDDSEIRVEITSDGHTATMRVRDQGPGMPWLEGSSRDIFARFVRGPGGGPEVRGSGLGLAIARAIVQRHGGDIEVLDPSLPGAHLVVTLPLDCDEDTGR